MASRSAQARRKHHNRSAAIQWMALVVVALLAVLAVFVLRGASSDSELSLHPPAGALA